MPRDRPTVREVAREAGLSVASVSRAISGARRVRPDIELRVREAAAKLGYTPDYLGRSLRSRTTSTVGMVVPDLGSPFFPALIQAVETSLQAANLMPLLLDAREDPGWERQCVENLIARQVDGLFISPTDHVASRPTVEFAAERVPVVQLDRYASRSTHQVITDPVSTIRMCLEHLGAAGCSRFVFVGSRSRSSVARDRRAAYRALVGKFEAAAPARIIEGAFTVEWGREAAGVIRRDWPEVDGVVCANDLIAAGVIQGATDLAVDVPRDLAVTGCDDTFFATLLRPAVTSIAQPVAEMADRAVDLLINHAADPPRLVRLQPALRPRASSARHPDIADASPTPTLRG